MISNLQQEYRWKDQCKGLNLLILYFVSQYYDTNSDWTANTKSISVTFPKAFPKAPSVEVAMYAAKLWTPEGSDAYGWDFSASDITTTGFTMNLKMLDRYFYGIYGVYIACTN